ncbi:hypothetical protein BCR37DRAFT_381825 [Protomyces lactucae-debilis]|uniref:Uncharacterized protein n=1 Tax=Protomyces lactucae-debilis TaxID=2754530 RepID=A0A1Y2F4W2_PROLT|nr:uncharacterized protein BCR37DRAFT_381825 [Protomyces lactucae-debilis]ORY78958.1 hypothetical protein BCR37DRAFT_381825 [Protomyces lactucae-debilis]
MKLLTSRLTKQMSLKRHLYHRLQLMNPLTSRLTNQISLKRNLYHRLRLMCQTQIPRENPESIVDCHNFRFG